MPVKGRLKSNGDLLIIGELDETTSGPFRIDSNGDIKNVELDETQSISVPMRHKNGELLLNGELEEGVTF